MLETVDENGKNLFRAVFAINNEKVGTDYKIDESKYNKVEGYSWKIMLKMYIFLLQSLLVESNSDFAWRTAHLYQVRE